MIQRVSRAPALGYWPDSALLSVEAVEDRLFCAAEAILLPDGLAGELADLLPDTDLIPACDVEALLELIPDRMPDATCAIIGKIFAVVLPELYGEPPRPRKRSDAFPGSHARLECLTRRVHAQSLLDHPADAQTPKIRPQVPQATPSTMLRLDTFHLGLSVDWFDSQDPESAWEAGTHLTAAWHRRVKKGI